MTTIITKNSSTAGAAPLAAALVQGELAVNVTSKALYTKNASAAVVKLNTPSIVDNGDATAITIDSSENVGIGTSSPVSKLHVNNTGSSITYATIGNPNGGTQIGVNASGASIVSAYSTQPIIFGINSGSTFSETMRLDSSGNLLVGQTATGLQNVNGFSVNVADCSISINHSSTPSGRFYSTFDYNGSIIGSITQNGTTGVLYNLTSDYRLKNNQQPLTGAKEFVMALQPKKWQWWDGSGEGVGFIAHEFMEVAKYSGHGEKDAVDENGKIIAQSIQPSSSEVMANLVAFIQELKAELDAAKTDIATLKGVA